jgi:two-component system, OmpR family, response regulator SaeR
MSAQRHSRPVILCVDDQETGLEIRKRMLQSAGYRVLISRNAHQALEIFRENRVDLVLTEHVVPTCMDAPTLAATLKMLKPEVPVAVYSADLVWPEDMRCADTFITKLVSVEELLHTIKRLLDKRSVAAAV